MIFNFHNLSLLPEHLRRTLDTSHMSDRFLHPRDSRIQRIAEGFAPGMHSARGTPI